MDDIYSLTMYKGRPVIVPGPMSIDVTECDEVKMTNCTVLLDPEFVEYINLVGEDEEGQEEKDDDIDD